MLPALFDSMYLAEHEFGEPHMTQWYVGIALFFIVIVVVVIIVATILILASRISRQAAEGTRALHAARMSTLPAWELQNVNQTAREILDNARSARQELEHKWARR